MSRTYETVAYDTSTIKLFPPKDKLVTEEYLNHVLTAENIILPPEQVNKMPQIVITEWNSNKIPYSYLNVSDKKVENNAIPAAGNIVIIKANDTDQPQADLLGTINRSLLGTVDNKTGRLLALDSNNNLPDILKGYTKLSEIPSLAGPVYIKTTSDHKLDSSWLNPVVKKDENVTITENNKTVLTTSNGFIDSSLFNIQRSIKVVSTKVNIGTAYTLSDSNFTVPSDPNKLFLFVNGSLLAPTHDYTIFNASQKKFTFTNVLNVGDILQFIAIN